MKSLRRRLSPQACLPYKKANRIPGDVSSPVFSEPLDSRLLRNMSSQTSHIINNMSPESLPQIDISPFLHSTPVDQEARRRCAEDIYNACTSTGFFYLTNHGIPTSQTDAVLSLGRDFFLDSSAEEKDAIVRKKVGVGNGDGARGWQPVRDNMTGGKRDWQEAVDMYREPEETENDGSGNEPPYDLLMGKNLWPQRPTGLRETYEDYVANMLQLGDVVCTAMGAALGVDEEVFVRHTKKSFWGMRLIGYAPIPETGSSKAVNDDDGISCGEHTDYGCVTLLLTDSVKGALQVKSTSGSWINADPIPGAFVVNIGDMMERWTNGLWRSTTHRVVHRGDAFRVSVPFFYEPDFGAR
jgi:isopenicillin N synthase-like dioxygenase